ncbi:zinc ribbon domain-containing protein [Mesorhizobium sp. M0959]|uniref:zinc ribbon domain-containing protein n=1 Tax=Mesorhizobium sp. M0959 TaxID=2957034 RepID=UPI00333628AE
MDRPVLRVHEAFEATKTGPQTTVRGLCSRLVRTIRRTTQRRTVPGPLIKGEGSQRSGSREYDATNTLRYYRCIGADGYRFSGHAGCDNPAVRGDRLEEAVWIRVLPLFAAGCGVHGRANKCIESESQSTRDLPVLHAFRTLISPELRLSKFPAGRAGSAPAEGDGLVWKAALHRFDQDRHQRFQPLPADPVRGLSQHDQRFTNRIVIKPPLRPHYRIHTSWLRFAMKLDSVSVRRSMEVSMTSIEYGLGRFGDRRLEKGGPAWIGRWWRGLDRVSVGLAANGRPKCNSRGFCANPR